MRTVVNRRATVHEPDKVQLLNAFAKALGKRWAEPKDTLRLEQFQLAWKQFDVALSHIQAEAIFNKYGQVTSQLKDSNTESLSMMYMPVPGWVLQYARRVLS